MPTINTLSAGSSFAVSLAAGSSLSFYGMGTAQIAPPAPQNLDRSPRALTPTEQRMGPFDAAVTVNLVATSGGSGISYYTLAPTDAVVPGANGNGAALTAAQVAQVQPLLSGVGVTGAALTLSASTTGQRQALGNSGAVSLTCAAGCTLYYRFTDASAAIAASTSDTPVVLGTTATVIPVPAGRAYFEYILASGTATVVATL